MFCRTVVRAALAAVVAFALSPAAFAENQPPQAQPQTVFTKGLEPLEIILHGSDPEGKDLRFEIVEPPAKGTLSDPEPIKPEPEIDPRTGEPVQPPVTSARVIYTPEKGEPDQFTFAVADAEGATGLAVVVINPPDSEPPPPPVETVIADDTEAEVYRDATATLTLTGKAPEGVSLTFAILSQPSKGRLGELDGNRVSYTPDGGYLGEDRFEFEACGVIDQKTVCDSAVYSIDVLEKPSEPVAIVSDVHVKTPMNRDVRVQLEDDHRPSVTGKPITLRALVAGNVADADGDGFGDNRNELPGDRPLFMSAGTGRDGEPGLEGTARMQMEFDLRELENVKEIAGASVVLRTHRASKEGVTTRFFAAGEGDGELQEKDFESPAEHIPGAVMPMPSLEQMPVDAEGTFTFDVLGELQAAQRDGLRVLALQGRVDEKQNEPAAGLDVRTTAEENLREQLEPVLVVEPAERPKPLTYSIVSLPDAGTLLDAAGNPIREVPYTLAAGTVTYVPPKGFTGSARFQFGATDGVLSQIANAEIIVFFGRCAEDAEFCNNGR